MSIAFGFLRRLTAKLFFGLILLTAVRAAIAFAIMRESAFHITGYLDEVNQALQIVLR